MGDNPTQLEAKYPLAPSYKRLGTGSYILAYFIIVLLVLTFLLGVYGIVTTKESVLGIAVCGIGLFLTYLNYNIVANAINCDRQMYGKDPQIPQY